MKIAMICAPYAAVDRPSFGLSILKSHAVELGHTVDIRYLNIDFVESFGLSDYVDISYGSSTEQAGESLISSIYNSEPDSLDKERLDIYKWYLLKAKELTDQKYDLYCFTCLFQQIRPSLWLAELIKKSYPDAKVVFGGAALDYPIGVQIFNSFRQIDYLFMGESEKTFTKFLDGIEKGLNVNYSSILSRNMILCQKYTSATLLDLDYSLLPDYDDYFLKLENSILKPFIKPFIFYETSRGCAWGEKKQCVFCGLNGNTINYRVKTARKALDDINILAKKYGGYVEELAFVDNIIPRSYFNDFIPKLTDKKERLKYFYEIKSSTKYDDLVSLKEAGVIRVQPGIESLSTTILKHMNKGVTAMQNISLLINCLELGISVDWNLILNIPNESEDSLKDMLDIIPLLRHVSPPDACCSFRLDRHSPIFKSPEEYGITNIKPELVYNKIYPELSDDEVFNVAYHYSFESVISKEKCILHSRIQQEVEVWKNGCYQLLHKFLECGRVEITDTRSGKENKFVLSLNQSNLYRRILSEKNSISINQLEREGFYMKDLFSLHTMSLLYKESNRVIYLSIGN